MTTKVLVERINSFRFFGERKITINAGDVYAAADDAQRELCSECELMEREVRIGLIAGQEKYSFPMYTVSSVAQAESGVGVLMIGAHSLQTGDLVFVANVGGDCNGTKTVTRQSSTTISLNGTTTPPGSYSGTLGTVEHYLSAMVRPKGMRGVILNATGAYSKIIKRDQEEMDVNRSRFATTGTPIAYTGTPIHYGVSYGETPEIILQPTPNAVYTFIIKTYSKPFEAQRVSATINPVLSSDYDSALYWGTLQHVIEQFKREPGADKYVSEAIEMYEHYKKKAMDIRAKRNFSAGQDNFEDLHFS